MMLNFFPGRELIQQLGVVREPSGTVSLTPVRGGRCVCALKHGAPHCSELLLLGWVGHSPLDSREDWGQLRGQERYQGSIY